VKPKLKKKKLKLQQLLVLEEVLKLNKNKELSLL
jgi:hypothetical protein